MSAPWECPRCHKINAPLTPFCDCNPKSHPFMPMSTPGCYTWPPVTDRCLICNGYHGKGLQCATLKAE